MVFVPHRTRLYAMLAAAGVVAPGCGSRAPAQPSSALSRYHLDAAPAWRATLPDELREISGLAVAPDGRVFAHGDEEGRVFEIEPRSGKVVKSFALRPGANDPDLGKKSKNGSVAGDFEDLAVVGARFFLVTSTGILVEFTEGSDGQTVPFTAHATGLADVCEVEGLAHDPSSQSLLLLCKEMKDKSARDRIEVWAWPLKDQRLNTEPRLTIAAAGLKSKTGAKAFNGSALTLIPATNSLALVAGPQQAFAELASSGDVVSGGALDGSALGQPEGMAFLADGTLLISTEGGKGGAVAGYQPDQGRERP